MDPLQLVPLLVFLVINALLVAYPLHLIVRKAGRPPWLTIIALFPYGGAIVVIWVLALSNWRSGQAGAEEVF
jgi:hypothetical protein